MKKFKLIFFLIFILSYQIQAQQNIENNFSITIKEGKLAGSFIASNNKENIVIIIAGSGPTDRNGNNPLGVAASSYKMLANELSKNNIASLRYDKRGVAESKVNIFKEKELRFENYIDDAVLMYQYAKDSLGYKNIYFIGHSEGSLIGIIASQNTKVKGFISLSGAGKPIDEVILNQLESQPENIYQESANILKLLKEGKETDDVPQYLYSLFRPSVQPYMISWIKYNPANEIKKLSIPVLIINGSCDVQVKPEEAQLLYMANTKNKVVIIKKMTHTLKNTSDDCDDSSMETYTNESLPLNKELVDEVVKFINH